MHDRRVGTRWGAILAAGALALTVAVPATAQDDAITKIGYASPEAAVDFGWNQEGLTATQAAAESVGAEVIPADGAGYGDVGPTLNSLKDDGAQFIVAQASGYGAPAIAFAPMSWKSTRLPRGHRSCCPERRSIS